MFIKGLKILRSCSTRFIHNNRYFTKDHEWIKVEDKNGIVGFTDHAQTTIGEIVYISIYKVGQKVNVNDQIGFIESSKAAVDIYSPVAGMIKEMNAKLEESPNLINKDPYEKGWIFKIDDVDFSNFDKFMTEKEYLEFIRTDK